MAGALGQVDAVFFERFALAFGVGAVHALAAAHGVDGSLQAFAGQAVFFGHAPASPLASAQASRNNSLAMNWSPRLAASFSVACSRAHVAAGLNLLAALHLGQTLQAVFGGLLQARHVHASALQQRFGAVFLPQHGHQQVRGFDVGVVVGRWPGTWRRPGLPGIWW
jgi:hypothetical protein